VVSMGHGSNDVIAIAPPGRNSTREPSARNRSTSTVDQVEQFVRKKKTLRKLALRKLVEGIEPVAMWWDWWCMLQQCF
jgi:hypothetical protein